MIGVALQAGLWTMLAFLVGCATMWALWRWWYEPLYRRALVEQVVNSYAERITPVITEIVKTIVATVTTEAVTDYRDRVAAILDDYKTTALSLVGDVVAGVEEMRGATIAYANDHQRRILNLMMGMSGSIRTFLVEAFADAEMEVSDDAINELHNAIMIEIVKRFMALQGADSILSAAQRGQAASENGSAAS